MSCGKWDQSKDIYESRRQNIKCSEDIYYQYQNISQDNTWREKSKEGSIYQTTGRHVSGYDEDKKFDSTPIYKYKKPAICML